MNLKNCVNCGAPIDKDSNKCNYCGSSYFDMSFLNLEAEQPFYLILKVKDMKIIQLVKPKMDMSISVSQDMVNCYGGKHHKKLTQFLTNYSVTTSLQFEAVFDKDKKMLEIIKEQKI